jgi:hypothetical protein
MRPPWLLAAVDCLPLRLFIAERSVTLDETLGAARALLLWSLLPERKRLPAGAVLLASATVLRELSPFRFAPTPHPFSWIPFAATFNSERQSAAVILLRKAFEYGALVWLLRTRGISYVRSAVVVAGWLAVLEAIQRYLPGRTPAITDSRCKISFHAQHILLYHPPDAFAVLSAAGPPCQDVRNALHYLSWRRCQWHGPGERHPPLRYFAFRRGGHRFGAHRPPR